MTTNQIESLKGILAACLLAFIFGVIWSVPFFGEKSKFKFNIRDRVCHVDDESTVGRVVDQAYWKNYKIQWLSGDGDFLVRWHEEWELKCYSQELDK